MTGNVPLWVWLIFLIIVFIAHNLTQATESDKFITHVRKMASVASLFDSCPAVVPQFKVLTKRILVEEDVSQRQRTDTEESTSEESKRRTNRENALRRKNKSRDPRDNRTVFVGNVSLPCTRKVLKQLFKKYGTVESVRLRSLRVQPGSLPAKLAMKTQQQLVEGSSANAYVVMETQQDAENCLAANGLLFQKRHLRVDLLSGRSVAKESHSKSVFVGNLPFTADEEKLRDVFSFCGQVEAVRVVRDKKTGIGKGFGFVSFSETSGVMFAVQKNRTIELDGRRLRVFRAKPEDTLKMNKFSGLKATRTHTKVKKPLQRDNSKLKAKSVVRGNTRKEKGKPIDRRTKSKK